MKVETPIVRTMQQYVEILFEDVRQLSASDKPQHLYRLIEIMQIARKLAKVSEDELLNHPKP